MFGMYERPYLKQVKGKIEEPRRFIHMADAGLGNSYSNSTVCLF